VASVNANAAKQKKFRPDPLMQRLDANQDGSLSQAELKTIASTLRGFDHDKNGIVSQEEIHAPQ
jgi:Ca2+-binding EF-hand superfamily protein